MSVAWSSSDKDVIERKVGEKRDILRNDDDRNNYTINDEKIREVFEVDRCASWIKDNSLRNVTLQFPDNLLHYAPIITRHIEKEIGGQRVAILGDTSYGDCCVDGVAAEHVGADSIIHFGDTCFSPTESLPVLYIFTQSFCLEMSDLEVQITEKLLKNDLKRKVAIFYDVHFHELFATSFLHGNSEESNKGEIQIKDRGNIFVCHPPFTPKDNDNSTNLQATNISTESLQQFSIQCGRLAPTALVNTMKDSNNVDRLDEDQNKWTILYVGDNDIYCQYLGLTFPRAQHYLYQPIGKKLVESNLNVTKALMRRYYAIEKTKDAERIGIIVGTLGVSKYCDIIEKCRDIIKCARKKPYTFLVGKPNAAKLANFPEIDIFVVVACPLNSIDIAIGNISKGRDRSGSDYFRPIITPFELDAALNPKQIWKGCDFKANYQTILPGGKDCANFEQNDLAETSADIDGTDISLITGKLRINGRSLSIGEENESIGYASESTSISTQERQLISQTHAGGGGQFLTERSWSGLEQKLGSDLPVLAVKGKTGIASNYVGEGE